MKTLGQTAGRKNGLALFHGIIPATTWGPTSTTAVDWHLKVKDIHYNVSLSKNYGITVSKQKISSIHKLILKTQQILGSHELNCPCAFLTAPTIKSLKQLSAFLDLYQHAKNQFIPYVHF